MQQPSVTEFDAYGDKLMSPALANISSACHLHVYHHFDNLSYTVRLHVSQGPIERAMCEGQSAKPKVRGGVRPGRDLPSQMLKEAQIQHSADSNWIMKAYRSCRRKLQTNLKPALKRITG